MSSEKNSSESSRSNSVQPEINAPPPAAPDPAPTGQPAVKPAVTVSSTKFALIMCSLWLGNFLAFYNETQATASMHVIGEQFHRLVLFDNEPTCLD
jgi:hypothetical protein